MHIAFYYIAVVLIWSTTPLAIVLSNDSLSSYAAVLGRMSLALVVVAVLVACFKPSSGLKWSNWKIYAAASFGIFPNMVLVYIAANYISSGMIAVVFAVNPLVAGVMASCVLKETFFNVQRILALILAAIGLCAIFFEQLHFDRSAWIGMCLILLSSICFSASQVLIKYFQSAGRVSAVEQTLGALLFALPGLLMAWYWFDGQLPETISSTSLYAIAYLAVVGTVLGFYAYYFILSYLTVTIVSIIPLITPLIALWAGYYFLDETVRALTLVGTGLIIMGLVIYGDLVHYSVNRLRRLVRA